MALDRLLAATRHGWRTQLRLQQRYLAAHATTGQQARQSLRRMRWSGSRLNGDLPPADRPR